MQRAGSFSGRLHGHASTRQYMSGRSQHWDINQRTDIGEAAVEQLCRGVGDPEQVNAVQRTEAEKDGVEKSLLRTDSLYQPS